MKSGGKSIKTWSTPVLDEERLPIPCAICGSVEFIPHFSCSAVVTAAAAASAVITTAAAAPAEVTAAAAAPAPVSAAEKAREFRYVRCARCGLVQMNPQPVPAAVALRYGENYGVDYLAYEKTNEAAFLRLQELALKDAGFFDRERELFSANPQGPWALDVGCAAGALPAMLQERGWKVRGVEISGPQAAHCRKRGLDVSGLPLEENHFPGESFDAILASHLIEHLNDPGSFVREVRRLLKPNGRFYLTTPNIAGLQARIFGSRWRSAIFDHLYLFSIKTLRKLLEASGFTAERVKTWGGLGAGIAPLPVKRILDALAKPLGFGDVMIIRAARTGNGTRRVFKDLCVM